MNFGEFVRQLRVERRITLRAFCRMNNIDPGNWSKIERGDMPPQMSDGVLETVAESLGIERDTAKWISFFDMAYVDRGKIPSDILTDEELKDALPAFFKTLRGQKLNDEGLDAVIHFIRRRNP